MLGDDEKARDGQTAFEGTAKEEVSQNMEIRKSILDRGREGNEGVCSTNNRRIKMITSELYLNCHLYHST